MLNWNIREIVDQQAQAHPDKPAIIFRDQPVTFSELREKVFRLANHFTKQGVQKQDKVALFLPNWPEYIYSYLALFSIGAIVVPFDFMLKNDELGACLNHCEAKLLIAKSKEDVSLDKLKAEVPSLKSIILVDETKTPGYLCFSDFLQQGVMDKPTVDIKESDHSLILYTSG